MLQVEDVLLRGGYESTRGRVGLLGTRVLKGLTTKVSLLDLLLVSFSDIAQVFAHDLACTFTVTAQRY